MEKQHYQAKRSELVRLMAEGHSYAEAARQVGQPLKAGMAKRLLKRYQLQGEAALQDGRQGHPSKFRPELRAWLKEYCQKQPAGSSRQLQALIREQFELEVSVSQLNRVRAELNLTRQAALPSVEQAATEIEPATATAKKKIQLNGTGRREPGA